MENTKSNNSQNNEEASKITTINLENPSSYSEENSSSTVSVPVVVEQNGNGNVESVVVGVAADGVDETLSNGNREIGRREGSRRTPFADLSQVDADLALARTLQEQERAYMMLRVHGDGSDYGSWDAGSYGHDDEDDEDFDDQSEEEYEGSIVDEDEEDAFDVHAHDEAGEDQDQGIELDPSAFSSDEAYARALQDAEEREMAARLLALAGINEMYVGQALDEEEHGGNSQDAWEEVDPDELSYEELIALGEVVGTESRGLSAETIASLPSVNYKSQNTSDGATDSCIICRLDYEDDDKLTVLSCKHSYHSECLNNWLQINKVCPMCSTEVSTSGNS